MQIWMDSSSKLPVCSDIVKLYCYYNSCILQVDTVYSGWDISD